MSSHLMIDIETMGVTPDAPICSIGACIFDLHEVGKITSEFETTISLESNELSGRHVQSGTLIWWLKQSKEAQAALLSGAQAQLRQALKQFRMWAQDVKPSVQRVWANDPDFDVVILRHAFDACGEMWPWHFSINRSVRTISELAFPHKEDLDALKGELRKDITHHRAVDDAVMQAKLVQWAYKTLAPCSVELPG